MAMAWFPATTLKPEDEKILRRVIWGVWAVVLLGAGVYHWLKVQEGRGAFIRWRPQVIRFINGGNIFEDQMFPNPPIFPLCVYPIMALPESVGAMTWFGLKAVLATVSAVLCFRMASDRVKPLSPWVILFTLALSFRTIESDLHHANNNIIILTLIVTSLYSWRKGNDALAGLLMALAISFKVTPGLFIPYFLYKRSWRTVFYIGVGMTLFLFIIPSMLIGARFNLECLLSWWKRILNPFISDGVPSRHEMNQSLVGVLFRLLTKSPSGGRYDPILQLQPIFSLAPKRVEYLVKGIQVAFVGLLALFCRTRGAKRTDPRMLGEFALVVLTMLIVSERSWKHHFVTLLLPFTYLVYRCFDQTLNRKARILVAASLVIAAAFMGTTSTEIGGWLTIAGGEGHAVAQWFGMFLWGAVALYIATAWRVVAERGQAPTPAYSAPHAVRSSRRSDFVSS